MILRNTQFVAILVGVLAGLCACNQPAYKDAIGDFQKSTEVATTAIQEYYSELNPYERELYLLERELNPKKAILDLPKTPLLNDPFDPKAIQARVALIQQLSDYARRLSSLAGNESAASFKTNTSTLAGSLTTLRNTFMQLSNRPNADTEAKDYISPLSTIAGIVGEATLARKRDKAVRKAILDGEQPIGKLFDFLERDLKKYVTLSRTSGSLQKLTELVVAYNEIPNRSKLTVEQRRQWLADIRRASEEYRIVKATQPADIVKAMRTAHQALMELAKDEKPASVGSLLSAMQAYEDQANELAKAVLQLKELHQ